MKRENAITVLLIIAVLALFAALPEDRSVEQEASHYCQMVHDHSWPDFHHVYADQCKSDGTVNEDYIYGR